MVKIENNFCHNIRSQLLVRRLYAVPDEEKMINAVYIHGGPGLNSYPESQMIAKTFEAHGLTLHFWNQPENLEGQDKYSQIKSHLIKYVLSFDQPVFILAHSWGARLFIDCVESFEDKILGSCLLAPALDFKKGDINICKKGREILKSQNFDCSKIDAFIESESTTFDEVSANALTEAFSSNYFSENFINSSNFIDYFKLLNKSREFNLDLMFDIRKSMPLLPAERDNKLEHPSVAIFGAKDPVFSKSSEMKVIEETFSNCEIIVLENCSHYPHIENSEVVIDNIKKLIN